MKNQLNGLAQRYVAGLKNHLKLGSRTSLQEALELGKQAIALELETLELARIHEQAHTILKLPRGKNQSNKRAQNFFSEAIGPIVQTHRVARESKIALGRLNEMLKRCTVELSVTNRQLKRGVARRKTVEKALKKSGQDYTCLLKDSLELQESLRLLTHQVIAAQEAERKKLSCELQDEVAQNLLGINVRLLSLKHEAKSNSKDLKNHIASTRQLVAESAKSVRGVADRLENL